MKYLIALLVSSVLFLGLGVSLFSQRSQAPTFQFTRSHWLLLHRKSNIEYLYYGFAGEKTKSTLVKTFKVKSGIPGERPTPLPSLLGKKYWIITEKHEETENPETAPYFLTLNVPVSDEEPFGPTPYLECNGQCNWILPGYFGLHGSGGDRRTRSRQSRKFRMYKT